MKLYHVSLGWTETPKLFIPRIPESRAKSEDDVTERICLSQSIEGCLSGMPNKPYKSNTKITLYECNVDDFVDYRELYTTGKVCDAYITKECWYLEPLNMSGKHLLLKDFESDWKYVPEETLKEEFICRVIYYLEQHHIGLSNGIIDHLMQYNVYQLLYFVLPPYFENNNLDLYDVCAGVLPTLRTIYNLDLSEVERKTA